jgi:acylphosphatase
VQACRGFRVTGKVQGVYFRQSTRREAQRLGLTGFARNLPDGSVEVFARGTETSLAELEGWLGRGPPQARVDAVEALILPQLPELPAGFEVR